MLEESFFFTAFFFGSLDSGDLSKGGTHKSEPKDNKACTVLRVKHRMGISYLWLYSFGS